MWLEQNPVPVWPEQNLRPEQLSFEALTQISQLLCDISNGTGPTGIGIVSNSDVLQCLNTCHSRRNFSSCLGIRALLLPNELGATNKEHVARSRQPLYSKSYFSAVCATLSSGLPRNKLWGRKGDAESLCRMLLMRCVGRQRLQKLHFQLSHEERL